MKRLILLLLAIGVCCSATAKVVLPKVLGSNMVLQQSTEIELWGKAEAMKRVTVELSWMKSKIKTQADSNGDWSVMVQTPKGSFDKYTITFSDGEQVRLENVMVGDVWVCAGQSNMEMTVRGFDSQPVENSLDYILQAGKMADHIRMFDVMNHRSYQQELWDCVGGEWQQPSSESVASTSATAYFFAYNLAEQMPYPIGIITADWGGSRVESWMPMKALEDILTKEQIEHKHTLHYIKPTDLYCGMIAPIKRFKARGFIWYQGEANLGYQSLDYLGDIDHYDIMLKRMVEQWREDWGDKESEMPFYYVMIAPFYYCNTFKDTTLPLFIECQQRALSIIPNSGMASTTDLGEATCIHPAKKFEVGQRLAALALAQTYGFKGYEPNAPMYESHVVKDGKIEVKMKNAPEGLVPRYGTQVTGFRIAGEDRVFHEAQATIKGGVVTVWSDQVKEPVAVRYCFHNVPDGGNLKSMYGLPAIPFRTDRWNDIK